MRLAAVRLPRFRALADLTFEPGPGLSLLVGENAQGKTSLLEAIHYLSTGRSFRTRNDRECIPLGSAAGTVARVEASLEWQGTTHTRAMSIAAEGKFLWVNEKQVTAISELLGTMPTVVIAAGDLEIVRGAPERRRSFVDSLIAQTDTSALGAMQDYAAALRGRNSLLRRMSGASRHELAAFESIMAAAAIRLDAARRAAARQLSQGAAREVAAATSGVEGFSVAFEPGTACECASEAEFRALWERDRTRDAERGHTNQGPHRDDFTLLIDGRDARKFASQGQCRTAALAMRIAGAEFLAAHLGRPPILLLDDVLGELDKRRASVFLSELSARGAQAILTTTDAAPILEAGVNAGSRFRLAAGKLEPF